MTNQELLFALHQQGQLPVPYFNNRMIQISEPTFPPEEVLAALQNFLALSNDQRRSDGRHLMAYCNMMIDAVGKEILDDMGGIEPTLENIWDYVTIGQIFFAKAEAKESALPVIYVQIEGDVAWEPEHGLQMSWANGKQLVKVSAFDGHPTNGDASANSAHNRHVFHCYKPELCTLPD